MGLPFVREVEITMPWNKRYLEQEIKAVLDSKKMVFVGGPRQVGKTTMCYSFLDPNADEQSPGYLN
jgi:predicted AAA+ superfamily ATPase